MGRRGCPWEFRHRVLDVVESGLPVVDVARDLGISGRRCSGSLERPAVQLVPSADMICSRTLRC